MNIPYQRHEPTLAARTIPSGSARAVFALWIQAQHPRWKAEADACIAKHGLVVFGDDPWPSLVAVEGVA